MSDKPKSEIREITQKFVDLFNRLLEQDHETCKELLDLQAPVHNENLDLICRTNRGKVSIGVLGFVNTALMDLGLPRVAVCRDDDTGQIVKFIANEKCKVVDTPFHELAAQSALKP